VTVIDLVALNHFMLISPSDRIEVVLVAGCSLSAGVAAALIVGHTTTRALTRLTSVARRLGENQLDARVGDLRASPELRQVGTALDVAAQRIADLIETERRTEAARRDLMTSISHDLRTPLANLRAMVEAIDDGVVDDPGIVREYSAQMLRSIQTLVAMVEDLFDLSQVDAAAFRTDARSIAVADAVRHAVELCDHDARASRSAPRSDIGCGRPLLGKARPRARLAGGQCRPLHPTGGSVTVTATTVNGALELSVQDSGMGLTGGQRDRVFEPFWRGDGSRSTRGSGLGLTLAQRITHALGGEIHALSGRAVAWCFDVVIPDDRSLQGSRVDVQ
jgi:signal transduction histidine kinase